MGVLPLSRKCTATFSIFFPAAKWNCRTRLKQRSVSTWLKLRAKVLRQSCPDSSVASELMTQATWNFAAPGQATIARLEDSLAKGELPQFARLHLL